ncbi:MAG: acyl-CoA dehydrogenase family protein [Gemmatimonadota bacterium]
MPIAATEEQRALQAAIRDWAKRAGTIALVRAQEPGAEPPGPAARERCWGELAGLGVFAIALPAAAGGAGGSVADLAAALEELTVALAPGPVLPTALAGLALAPHASLPGVGPLLAGLAAGEATAAVCLPTPALTGGWQPDGTLRVTGGSGLTLAAGAAGSGWPDGHLLAAAVTGDSEVWFAVPATHPGVTVTGRDPADFSRPLATAAFDAVIGPGQVVAGLSTARVRALTATLYAAEAAGVAAWCSATAAEYARTRHQFGRPIGSFQAVKHLCAGMLCRAETAAALAWDAARAADEAPAEHPLAAAAAAALALDAAVDNAKDCIQVLGGIGFTWEHDAHLYLRRALALRQLLGGSAAWQERTASLALAGARRRVGLAVTGPAAGGGPEAEAAAGPAAAAARAVAATVAALPEDQRRAALADAGYVAPHWPPPYGLGASPADQLVIDEELHRAGLTRPDLVIGGWAGLAVVQHGTDAQREAFAGPTLRGEITWCQLFSEPEAGSDLASLRTRATRVPGGWRLTGQKVWTSLAHQADWAICLARTDPPGGRSGPVGRESPVPKHRGITFFLVDMHSDGIDIRPLREITGRAMFNEVFLDEVFVPDDRVVGEPGGGWRIARSALATERLAMGRGSAFGDEVEGLLGKIRADGLAADPRVLARAGTLVADGLAGSLLDLRAAQAQLAGTDAGHLAAVRKLQGVAHRQAVAEAALLLAGPDGAAEAEPLQEFLMTRCLSIAGGTTQILLSMVGERVLGLPREEMR